jgi:hypothetical protein
MADELQELELYGVALCAACLIVSVIRKRKWCRRRRPKFWVSAIFKRLYQRGATYTLLPELTYNPSDGPSLSQYCFKANLRMNETTYNSLFHLIEPKIAGSPRFFPLNPTTNKTMAKSKVTKNKLKARRFRKLVLKEKY